MSAKLKVLIVDDDVIIREMLRLTLHEAGNYIVSGESGDCKSARKQLKENPPNLVLLDIVLPGDEGGLDLLRFIKKDYPEIRVIMISGEPSSERVQSAISSGAKGFIVKPFNAQYVKSTISRLIPQI